MESDDSISGLVATVQETDFFPGYWTKLLNEVKLAKEELNGN